MIGRAKVLQSIIVSGKGSAISVYKDNGRLSYPDILSGRYFVRIFKCKIYDAKNISIIHRQNQ